MSRRRLGGVDADRTAQRVDGGWEWLEASATYRLTFLPAGFYRGRAEWLAVTCQPGRRAKVTRHRQPSAAIDTFPATPRAAFRRALRYCGLI